MLFEAKDKLKLAVYPCYSLTVCKTVKTANYKTATSEWLVYFIFQFFKFWLTFTNILPGYVFFNF